MNQLFFRCNVLLPVYLILITTFLVSEKLWEGPFYFVQGADSQFGLTERYIEKKEVYGWEKEKDLARQCVQKINSLEPKPKFFVICGDLCDAFPGT